MQSSIIETLMLYHGLDWVAVFFGLSGTWCLSNCRRTGFLLCSIGSVAGFAVALMSGQFGFVAYNLIIMAMMMRGFLKWNKNILQAAE